MKNDDILIDQSSNNREITVKEEYEDKDEGKKNIALKNLIVFYIKFLTMYIIIFIYKK